MSCVKERGREREMHVQREFLTEWPQRQNIGLARSSLVVAIIKHKQMTEHKKAAKVSMTVIASKHS